MASTNQPDDAGRELSQVDPSHLPTLLVERERSRFRSLILHNPNYFGNFKDSPFEPVKSIVSNTSYEELKCVGFQPQLNRLEAVVWIHRETGYSGDICSSGSPEFVRFWLSYDDGATWLDQGMESFTAYDIPGDHPLEYAVSLSITPRRRICFRENLPLVRAILSWNQPPTDPDTPPVWGNVVDARIQIEPRRWIEVPDLLEEFKLSIPPVLEQLLEPAQVLQLKPASVLSAAQLKAAYAGKEVPDHRFLHREIQKLVAHPTLTANLELPTAKGPFAELNVNFEKVLDSFFSTSGDTSFEELTCIGLDPNTSTPDALVGVLRIKRPDGYLGSLCDNGSIEYIAFWVDWGDGAWDWVGTAQVRVHDVASIPREGLAFAVYQPVNLEAHRLPCKKGPVVVRVRAILSWNEAPPPSNPNFTPRWGNRLGTRVHIYPGASVATGDYTPYMQNLCGQALCNIEQPGGYLGGDRPFGGVVYIFGHIPGAPDVTTVAANRPRYRITVRPAGSTTMDEHLNNAFGLTIDEQMGSALPTSTNVTQAADAANWYAYQEAPPVPGVGWRTVSPSRLLAVWSSFGKTGRWEIEIRALDPVTGTEYVAGTVICTLDGSTRQNVIVALDQAPPVVNAFTLTGYQRGGAGPILVDILNCGTFQVGDLIHGRFDVSDEHLAHVGLSAEPTPDGGAGRFTIDGVATRSVSYAAGTTNAIGEWTFDTAGLEPCGYTIQLGTSDRTVASCGGGWSNSSEFIGFCLVEAVKK